MDAALPATSYAVLGMLSIAPMSGYELTNNVDKTIAHFWSISKSQVYGELARLEELGLVDGTNVSQDGVPDKRTYELTDDGATALDGWLAIPVHERTKLRSTQLLKMFFAHRMSPADVDELLTRYGDDAEARRVQLASIVDLLAADQGSFYARATALIGLRSAEATLAALDEIRRTLPGSSTKLPGSSTKASAARKRRS